MPIQFRCASCQQLLGIAKRKAGSVVDCPTCNRKTLVPSTSTENAIPEPPVQRERTKPVSIFDRMDVDKLLQKPAKPELAEDEQVGVAVAPPPVRRKVTFHPDPIEQKAAVAESEPQTLQRLETGDAEPLDDEPFALTSVPKLAPVGTKSSTLWLSLYLAIGGLAVLGAFFAGHWVGAKRPLF